MERINREFVLTIDLPEDAGVVEVRRCDDHFFEQAASLSRYIEHKDLWIWIMRSSPPGLPKTYAALSMLTGPSGDLYDPWKGAFAFPFKVTIRRNKQEFRYLLKLTSLRGSVVPDLYRLNRPGDSYDRYESHDPFDDELSEDEAFYVFNFINGYIEGFCEAVLPVGFEPFVKTIDSDLILFGYDGEKFFAKEYRGRKTFEKALKRWRAVIPEKTMEEQLVELDW